MRRATMGAGHGLRAAGRSVRARVMPAAVLLAGAVALVGPAVAERAALGAVRTAAARCGDGSSACGGVAQVDVDAEGLRLWHPWRDRAGMRIAASQVTVALDASGVMVEAEGLQVAPEPTTGAGRPGRQAERRASAAVHPAKATTPKRRSLHTRGVPVHVRARGGATLVRGGVTVTVRDPALHLDGHGGAMASFALRAEGRGVRVEGTERVTATAIDGDPERWRVEGTVSIAEGPPTHATVTVTEGALAVQLRDGDGGELWVDAPRPSGPVLPDALRIRAQRFGLAALGRLGRRTLDALGLRTEGVRVDGQLSLEGLQRPNDAGTAELAALRVEGLVIDHRKLAREPVALDALELHGTLAWGGDTAGGTLWVAHRQARVSVSGQRSPDAFDLRTELAPLSCQALLDAFPAAMSEMVAGTVLEGQLHGHAELHLDRAALHRARAEGAAVLDPDHPPLGRLDFAFPFLERCTVTADDPRLDLAALSGAYHHRFVDDRGHEQRRVMAPGAPGYVSLADVPLLARAFVVLEDRRFWHHDGFDREQIEHALWHNLVQGRVSRGASTISQQAARNLWLGVDRSWGRKLQEALLTARLEATTDKARIMELYLNVIELGSGTHGVDEAARLYFGKPAAELTVLQSIHLAALAPAPARYAERFVDGRVDARWLDMLHEHVRRMHRAGLIGWAQQQQALREELGLLDRRR